MESCLEESQRCVASNEGMYFPEFFGRSDGGKFTVTSGE
jgi:hypothetical protein